MMTVEVLVASMNQDDFSIVKQMNIHTDAVFANQCSRNEYSEEKEDNLIFKMISTSTRGVGINRNIGLQWSSGDILLFSDQDVSFLDGYEDTVKRAFETFPQADVILFGTQSTKNGSVISTRIPKKGKMPFIKALRYGTTSIAIKRKSYLINNLSFTHLFGGGCLYSHGEDSDFIVQCYKKRMKIYGYDRVVSVTSKDSSTCFTGYDEKYFYDAGALSKQMFGPLLRKLYLFYIARRIKDTSVSKRKRKEMLRAGLRNFKALIPYEQFVINETK